MSNCPDLCTRAECEALRKEIENLKADFKILKADLRRHIRETVNEDTGGGAHRFIPSKKSDPKFYLTYYPNQNLLKGQIELNNKTAKAQTEINLTPKLDLTYYPDDKKLKGQVKIGKLVGKGETKIDLTPKLDLTYYPDDNKLKGQVKIGKLVGKGETKIDLTPKLDLTYYPDDNKLKGQVKIGKLVGKGETEIDLKSLKLEPTIKLSWDDKKSKFKAIIRIGKETDEDEVTILAQTLKDFKLSYDKKSFNLTGTIKYGTDELTSKTEIVLPEIKNLKLVWSKKDSKLSQSFMVGDKKLEANTIIEFDDQTPKLTLKWDANNCVLTVKITIGKKSAEAKIDMNCKPIIDLLKDIQKKVTVDSTILSGHCEPPTTEGDYNTYQQNPAKKANGLSEAFTLLSEQLKENHEDTCKAISIKVEIPSLPKFNRCEYNDQSQTHEIKSFDILDIFQELGIIVPALLRGNKAIVIEEVIRIGLGFLWDYISAQNKGVLQGQCDIVNQFKSELEGGSCEITNSQEGTMIYKKSPKATTESLGQAISTLSTQISNLHVDFCAFTLVPKPFKANIKLGHCDYPRTTTDWFEYIPDQTYQAYDLGFAIQFLSDQIEAIHKDACKAILPKIPPPSLPRLTICQLNDDGEKEIHTLSYQAMQAEHGFIAPWEIGQTSEVLLPIAIEQFLHWYGKVFEQQTQINLAETCKDILLPALKFPEIQGCLPEIEKDPDTGNDVVSTYVRQDQRIILIPSYKEGGENVIREAYIGELPQKFWEDYAFVMNGIKKDGKDTEKLKFVDWFPEFARGYLTHIQAQSYFEALANCNIQSTEPYVLLPDPRGVWDTDGWYLFFYWTIVNPTTEAEKKWNQRTQLARPLDSIINANKDEREGIWDKYFADIYQILGCQWGQIYAEELKRRNPLYKGWFKDIEEGKRALAQIAKLSAIPVRDYNNPVFSVVCEQKVRLVNDGKKIALRKVCVGYKGENSDKIDQLYEYKPRAK